MEERLVKYRTRLTQGLAQHCPSVLTQACASSVERVRELHKGVTLMHGDACRETQNQLITTLRLVKFSSCI
jgi:hypothetical protein